VFFFILLIKLFISRILIDFFNSFYVFIEFFLFLSLSSLFHLALFLSSL
jgi:hypothetical protein